MSINLTGTQAAATATTILASFVKKEKVSKVLTPEQEAGKAKTIAMLAARAPEGQRITYGMLGMTAINNGWVKRTKAEKFDGQIGSSLMSQIPAELQPFVCRAAGGYDKKALAQFEKDDSLPTIDGKTSEEVLCMLKKMPAEAPTGERTYERKVSAKKDAAAPAQTAVDML